MDNTNKFVRIVWLAEEGIMFEEDWINHLLKDVSIETIYDNKRTKTYENAMIVCNHADHEIGYDEYFQKYEDANIPFVAIHLSDEILDVSYKFYEYNMCKAIFRNYIHPHFMKHEKVHVFGLGYKTGFCNTAEQDEVLPWYHWSFVGTIHNDDREKQLSHYKNIIPHIVIKGDTFGKGVDITTYRRIMEMSKFTLCLLGQCNVETFRFYESLEAGSIPIVLGSTETQLYDSNSSYWHMMFPWAEELPFIIIQNWEEGVLKMIEMLNDPVKFYYTRDQLQIFWKKAKQHWKDEFRNVLLDVFSQR